MNASAFCSWSACKTTTTGAGQRLIARKENLLTAFTEMARIKTIMALRQPYDLAYARCVADHLKFIDAKYDSLIRSKIEEQLRLEPSVETKYRKPLRQPAPFAVQWEIRFGPHNRFRVLYDIDEVRRTVQILAIGEKARNQLIVGGEDVEL